jgi:hypothetical protein
VESPINPVVSRPFVKKQQMAWTLRGARLLLQTHTRVLNNELDDGFGAGYPKFRRAHVTTELRALPNPDLLAGLLYW